MQDDLRKSNHNPSVYCKTQKKQKAVDAAVEEGDLVFIKSEGSKHCPRERYIICKIVCREALLQKMNSMNLGARKYEVPLSHLLPVVEKRDCYTMPGHVTQRDSNTSSDEEIGSSELTKDVDITSSESESEEDTDGEEEPGQQPVLDRAVRRSTRNRREPAWMRNSEWAR